ncbi:MAG: ribonuclease HI family protein [Phycisphaerae bacterium]|nr:ribonuclease HI family protein [Phycisphaerae bacterium]
MKLIIKTDGGSRGNPGPAAAGIYITDANGKKLFAGGFYLGNATNNVAEYTGLLRGMEIAGELGGTDLEILCDSELIVKQVNGQYKVKNANLRPYYEQIVSLKDRFKNVTVRHIYRSDNTEPDALVNKSLDVKKDIGGMLGESAGESESPVPLGPAPRHTIINLREKVKFDASGRCHEILAQTDSITSKVIALQPGQCTEIQCRDVLSTLTVMRGSGDVKVGSETISLKAGLWVQIDKTGSITPLIFKAESGEQLIVILSHID